MPTRPPAWRALASPISTASPLVWLVALIAVGACGRTQGSVPSVPSVSALAPAPSGVHDEPGPPAPVLPRADGAHARASDAQPDVAPSAEATDARALAGPATATGDAIAGAEPGMLLVPGGPFTMGTDVGGEEDEHPAHTVTVAAFWLDRTEVTNAAWEACVASGTCRPKSPSVRVEHPDFNGPDQPVSGVSWDDARAYCAWENKRLPREAEYEKAVRGTDERRYAWGSEAPTRDRAVFSSGRTEDVATHPAGRGPYGHDDLAGNVWEWLEDEYDPLAYRRPSAGDGTPATCAEILTALDDLRRHRKQGFTGTNPIPTECEHAIRGGAYNYDPHGLRATNRVHHPGWYRIPMLGVRCAKNASSH